MNLKKKVIKIDGIEGKDFSMSLDFESAMNFQEATGLSIFKGVQRISQEMDIISLAFLLAFTLRDENEKAVGIDFIKNLDLQGNLEYFMSKISDLMDASLPKKDNSKKK